METSSAHNGNLGDAQPIHPDGFLVAEAVTSYGLGAEAFNYWLWRQQRTGAELPHSAILSAWNKPEIGYESVAEVERSRQRLAPFLAESQAIVPQVALTWSDLGREMLATEHLGASQGYVVDYNHSISAWHGLLLDAGLPRDIRFENASLTGIKLLFTPNMLCVSDEFLTRVSDWMRQGGIWVCGPLTGLRTKEHTVPTDAALGPLEALAGIETVYSFPASGAGMTGRAWGMTAPLTGWCNAFRVVAEEAKSVGVIGGEHAAGLNFITERKIGRGAIVLLGALPDGKDGQAMLERLIKEYADQARINVRYQASAGTIVCPRETKAGRMAWLVVNLDGRGGQIILPRAGKDAISGKRVAAGGIALGRYAYRAIVFDD